MRAHARDGVDTTTPPPDTVADIRSSGERMIQRVAILCAGLLRRGMVCERECDGFFCSITVTYDGTVLS